MGSPLPQVTENLPFGSGASGQLRGLASDATDSSQEYTRRVDRFEQMMKAVKEGKPAPDPQTWFNDMGPVDQAKVDEATTAIRGVIDDFVLLSATTRQGDGPLEGSPPPSWRQSWPT